MLLIRHLDENNDGNDNDDEGVGDVTFFSTTFTLH